MQPKVSSVQIANDNNTIAVTMNEPVYRTTGSSGALEKEDFALYFGRKRYTCIRYTHLHLYQRECLYARMNLSGQASDMRRSPLCRRLEVVFTMRPTTPHRRAIN